MIDDEQGSPSEEHKDLADHEHAQQEAEPGVWSDDRPPADDFADAGGAAEEIPTVSQESAGDTDDAALPAPERSRSLLPLFLGIAGVLALGGVVYWQLGTAPTSAPPSIAAAPASANDKVVDATVPASSATTLPMSQSNMPAPSPAAPPEAVPSQVLAPAGGGSDINALKSPDVSASGTVSAAMPSVAPTIPPATPNIETVQAAQSPTAAPQAMRAMPAPAAAPVAAVEPIPMPAAGNQNTQSRIETLSARVEELQKSLEQANRQLSEVSNMVVATATTPSLGNTAVEERLSKLEQNVAEIEKKKVAKSAPVLTPALAPAENTAVKQAAAHTLATPKAKHVQKKAKAPVRKTAKQAAPKAAPSKDKWFLRAATPNEAWVSTSATSPELRHVRQGDVLPGIGQVQAIRQSTSGWEIQGSEGLIR